MKPDDNARLKVTYRMTDKERDTWAAKACWTNKYTQVDLETVVEVLQVERCPQQVLDLYLEKHPLPAGYIFVWVDQMHDFNTKTITVYYKVVKDDYMAMLHSEKIIWTR